MNESRPPSSLRNLGLRMDQWLREAGIDTVGELRALGAIEAWERLRFVIGPRVSVTALYALDAALNDQDWRALPPERRRELKEAAEAYKAAVRA